MSDQRSYLYFGKNPTNVCYNGTSFPINPKDVIKCYPAFIEAFINPKWYRELREGEDRKPKFTFPHTPFFIRPDPLGGLPMRSDPNAGPKLKNKMPRPPTPLRVEDDIPDELYGAPKSGGSRDVLPDVEVPTLEITTAPTGPSVPEPKGGDSELSTFIEESESISAVTLPDDGLGDATIVLDDPITEDPAGDEGPNIPTRSALRKQTLDEIRALAFDVAKAGCSLNVEMFDTFEEFDEETTRGVMFAALWKYYGFDD